MNRQQKRWQQFGAYRQPGKKVIHNPLPKALVVAMTLDKKKRV